MTRAPIAKKTISYNTHVTASGLLLCPFRYPATNSSISPDDNKKQTIIFSLFAEPRHCCHLLIAAHLLEIFIDSATELTTSGTLRFYQQHNKSKYKVWDFKMPCKQQKLIGSQFESSACLKVRFVVIVFHILETRFWFKPCFALFTGYAWLLKCCQTDRICLGC